MEKVKMIMRKSACLRFNHTHETLKGKKSNVNKWKQKITAGEKWEIYRQKAKKNMRK